MYWANAFKIMEQNCKLGRPSPSLRRKMVNLQNERWSTKCVDSVLIFCGCMWMIGKKWEVQKVESDRENEGGKRKSGSIFYFVVWFDTKFIYFSLIPISSSPFLSFSFRSFLQIKYTVYTISLIEFLTCPIWFMLKLCWYLQQNLNFI